MSYILNERFQKIPDLVLREKDQFYIVHYFTSVHQILMMNRNFPSESTPMSLTESMDLCVMYNPTIYSVQPVFSQVFYQIMCLRTI